MMATTGYERAIRKAKEIRLQRKKIYSDNWREMEDWELLALIRLKANRLKTFVIDKRNEKLHENRLDTLTDLVNYSLFMLEKELNRM